MPATAEAANSTGKRVVFKSCAPFTDCIRKTNNTQVDNAKDIDVVMFMYNFIEYSDIYLKTSGNLWQYCRNVPSSVNNNINFPAKKIIAIIIIIIVFHSNLKKKLHGQQETMIQKMSI